MKIVNVVCAPGRTGFFFDDQKAIKSGAKSDGAAYIGQPVTSGFKSIRQAGESISVMLVLEDGQIAWGDCAAVQYSGAGGRDPLFLAEDFIPVIDKYIKPALVGKEADSFRELTKMMEAIEVDGKRLHTAIRYGVSQAILDAVAKSSKRLMSEVVADEYGTTVSEKPIPIFTQSGDNRYENADKMILKGAAILPHALINNVETKLGRDGSKLKEYVCWLRDRILQLRTDESYCPVSISTYTEPSVRHSAMTTTPLWLITWQSWKRLQNHSTCASKVQWTLAKEKTDAVHERSERRAGSPRHQC